MSTEPRLGLRGRAESREEASASKAPPSSREESIMMNTIPIDFVSKPERATCVQNGEEAGISD